MRLGINREMKRREKERKQMRSGDLMKEEKRGRRRERERAYENN